MIQGLSCKCLNTYKLELLRKLTTLSEFQTLHMGEHRVEFVPLHLALMKSPELTGLGVRVIGLTTEHVPGSAVSCSASPSRVTSTGSGAGANNGSNQWQLELLEVF